MMTPKRRSTPDWNAVAIALGVALLCTGIVLHWALPARYATVDMLPVIVGAGIALYAAVYRDPPRGKAAAVAVTGAAGEFVHSAVEFRTGDRGSDPVVRVEKTSDPARPDVADSVRVSVTTEAPGTASAPMPSAPSELELPPLASFGTPSALERDD